MGEKGLEPIRPFGHTVLSRARLQVPPPAHLTHPALKARGDYRRACKEAPGAPGGGLRPPSALASLAKLGRYAEPPGEEIFLNTKEIVVTTIDYTILLFSTAAILYTSSGSSRRLAGIVWRDTTAESDTTGRTRA